MLISVVIGLIVIDLIIKIIFGVTIAMDVYRNIAVILTTPFALLTLIPIFIRKEKSTVSWHPEFASTLSRIIVFGVLVLVFFSVLSVVLSQAKHWDLLKDVRLVNTQNQIFSRSGSWLRLGLALEALILSFGLAYKQRKYDEERLLSLDRNALTLGGRHLESHLFQMIRSATRTIEMDKIDKQRLDDLVDHLSGYYKEVLDSLTMNNSFTLNHELRMAKNFLEITKLAGHNDHYTFEISTDLDNNELSKIFIPPLIINTFLENAYHHGIQGYKGACEIQVTVRKIAKTEYGISILNTGRSMAQEEFQKIQANVRPENLSKHRLEYSASDMIHPGGRSGRGVVNALARIYLFNKLNKRARISIAYDEFAHIEGRTKVILKLKISS